MSAAPFQLGRVAAAWSSFFFAPRDPKLCGLLRIGYATLLLINVLVWLPDLDMFFSETGALPLASSRKIIDSDTLTIFSYLPTSRGVLWACYGAFVGQIVLLLLGVFSRLQAASVFVWLVSFQHRNIILFDGEDTVFRLFCFFLILCPCGYAYSLDARWRPHRGPPPVPWGLRLFQIQISLIYFSTALFKMKGEDWENGTALYYVSRLDDLFGRFPLPQSLFDSMPAIQLMTWAVVLMELLLPFALWFKETRRIALLVGLSFHLATDYAMNLFLFHWIMILGLMSFTTEDDWIKLKALPSRLRRPQEGSGTQSSTLR